MITPNEISEFDFVPWLLLPRKLSLMQVLEKFGFDLNENPLYSLVWNLVAENCVVLNELVFDLIHFKTKSRYSKRKRAIAKLLDDEIIIKREQSDSDYEDDAHQTQAPPPPGHKRKMYYTVTRFEFLDILKHIDTDQASIVSNIVTAFICIELKYEKYCEIYDKMTAPLMNEQTKMFENQILAYRNGIVNQCNADKQDTFERIMHTMLVHLRVIDMDYKAQSPPSPPPAKPRRVLMRPSTPPPPKPQPKAITNKLIVSLDEEIELDGLSDYEPNDIIKILDSLYAN